MYSPHPAQAAMGREGDERNRRLYSYNPLTVELI
jgi:hypothetical protein